MTTNTTTTNKSASRARKSGVPADLVGSSTSMDDDGDTDTSSTTGSVADKLLGNEMRAHKNRGFHDGYDAGKKSTLQNAYDGGYKKAFEQNFILSTLKGVANALKSSHRNHMQQISAGHQSQSRPTSAISAMSTSPAPKSSPGGGGSFVRRASSIITSSTSDTHDDEDHDDHHRNHRRRHHNDVTRSNRPSDSSLAPATASPLASTSSSSRRRQSSPYAQTAGSQGASAASSVAGGDDVASTCSSSSISSNRSSTAGCYSSTNVSISSNHLSLLDSMKFDATSDIESIKKDLIKICRENRLEILAHYVSQIG